MKASGQFGVSELQQYMVSERGGPPLSHMFKLSSPHFQQLYHAQHSSLQSNHSLLPPPPPRPPHLQQQQQAFVQHQDQQQHEKNHEVVHGQDFPDDPSYPSPSPSSNYNRSVAGAVADQSVGEDHEELAEKGERGTQGNRWPRQETHALLKIRSEMDATFRDSNMKSALWEEVSRKMSEIGYSRSAKNCKEKFENVHKYYKRTKEGKSGKQDGKSYRFYTQLEALYGNANLSSPTVNKSAENLSSAAAAANNAGLSSPFLFPGAIPAEAIKSNKGTEAAQRLDLDHRTDLDFFSESSEDDYGDPRECDTPESRKRKRKRLRLKLMQFFETLIRRVLEKQEEMQQKFLEALEKRDHERMMREEAWRRQEMARISREHELRVQDSSFAATRDAALVSFLQKYIGQPLELPQMQIIPAKNVHAAQDLHEEHFQQKDHDVFDNSVKRWPKPEIHALIKLRTGFDSKFRDPGPKNPVWEEISSKMCSLGYKRSAKRCKEKWENINKYFRKAKESNKSRSEDSKTCPYFHILDTLYSKGLLGQKQLGYRTEDHSEEVLDQPSESNKDEESGQAEGGDSDNLASNNSDIGLNITKMAPNIMNFASSGNAHSFSQNFEGVRIGNDASEMREKPVAVTTGGGYEKMEMKQAEKHVNGDRTAPSSTFMAYVMEIPPNYSISSLPQLHSECNV